MKIAAYRPRGDSWVLYGYTSATAITSGAQGSYTAKVPLAKGMWRLRAYVPADAGHAATWSGYSSITVK